MKPIGVPRMLSRRWPISFFSRGEYSTTTVDAFLDVHAAEVAAACEGRLSSADLSADRLHAPDEFSAAGRGIASAASGGPGLTLVRPRLSGDKSRVPAELARV